MKTPGLAPQRTQASVSRPGTPWTRRARPLLGTLVEVGVRGDAALAQLAFAAVAEAQACLSRFDPGSDVARFHALPAGGRLRMRPHTAQVLAAAAALHEASGGLFDITLGTAPQGWRCAAGHLTRLDTAARLDLGGIGKGHAVDAAVRALQAAGCPAGWVNAGGDLRVFGDVELPVLLRDESLGGARPFAALRDGAFATSRFAPDSRCRAAPCADLRAHASVAAPLCLWADALTKVVALSGDASHPLLARHGAQAWLH